MEPSQLSCLKPYTHSFSMQIKEVLPVIPEGESNKCLILYILQKYIRIYNSCNRTNKMIDSGGTRSFRNRITIRSF